MWLVFSGIRPALHTTTEEKLTVRRNVGGISCIDDGWIQDYRCECKIKQTITSDMIQSIIFSPGTLCIPGLTFLGTISDPLK